MGLTGDRYVGSYNGHAIELVANEWTKTLKLRIDGQVVDSESRILPHNITLRGTFEHNGVQHAVVAKSIIRFPWTDDTVEIDGKPFLMDKTK